MAVRIAVPEAPLRLVLLACACSVLPDADAVLFWMGVPYAHPFGHRGFFHSLFFAAAMAGAGAALARDGRPIRLFFLLFVVGASHGVLDAMTDGGLGVAFFAPFDNTRSFLPWRPLVVSPIGVTAFLSEWGLHVMRSEVVWVWLPLLGVLLVVRTLQGGAARLR